MSIKGNFLDRADSWRPELPHNALPDLPPPGEVETKAVLKLCIAARAAVAELRQAAELIPNQAILISTLPLLEAQASSAIENIVTSTDQLFLHLTHNEHADPATREALRYREALFEGHQALAKHPLTTRTAEIVCTRIKGVEMAVRRLPGIALHSSQTGRVVYTPPEGEALLRDKLANWERFIHGSSDLDPLVRMAIAHYQFEAIHPFADGNGRTGRVLNSLLLIEQELLTLPILYLSRFINQTRSEYYRLLLRVTSDGDWESWLLYLLRGIEDTARWTTHKIAAIRALSAETTAHVQRARPKIYSHELLALIFELPYCRIANVTARGIAKRQTASSYLKQLVEIGVLTERPIGNEKLFVNQRLMQLLTTDYNGFEPFEAP